MIDVDDIDHSLSVLLTGSSGSSSMSVSTLMMSLTLQLAAAAALLFSTSNPVAQRGTIESAIG